MNPELSEKIINVFNLVEPVVFTKVEKGFSSHNYKVETGNGLFFLKKHRTSGADRIGTIEKVEEFFTNHNVPVIGPIKSKNGNLHEIIDQYCYVLYPFVSGKHYETGNVPIDIVKVMGRELAKIHLLTKDGIVGEYEEDTHFKLQEKEHIIFEIEELLKIIKPENDFDVLSIDGLKLKKKLVTECTTTFESLNMKDRHLCLGDYYTDNIFFTEDGKILNIFDLDMAGPTPRMYELVRACMLTCFWYGYSLENIDKAKAFINSYFEVYAFTSTEFRSAIELYYTKSFYSIWREYLHYIKKDFRNDITYKTYIEEMHYLTENREKLFVILDPNNANK